MITRTGRAAATLWGAVVVALATVVLVLQWIWGVSNQWMATTAVLALALVAVPAWVGFVAYWASSHGLALGGMLPPPGAEVGRRPQPPLPVVPDEAPTAVYEFPRGMRDQ